MSIPSLLNDEQQRFWESEKRTIQNLLETLQGWETRDADLEHLRRALSQLNELFLLVFVGEFNSGKSALINALLGKTYLKEGVTPTTDRIHILKYGEPGEPDYVSEDVRVLHFPAEMLREIHIVDTPGTNAVLRKHEAIARDFVPRSDMVIFVTSADRPFTESERNFLEVIRQWGKKVIVIINKVDILPDEAAYREVRDFVEDKVQELLGFPPELFTLSAKESSSGGSPSVPSGTQHGLKAFQTYLTSTLTQEELIRLKLLSPLGVALKITDENIEKARERGDVLNEDVMTLERVEHQLALYESDTTQEFDRHLAKLDNELLEMRLRGEEFLDDRLRLLKIRGMLRGEQLQRDFQEIVIADTPDQIGREIQEIIDWLVERELRQWRLMAEELGKRTETDSLKSAARKASEGFAYSRRELLESLGAKAERVVSSYDESAESQRLTSLVQESVALVGLVEVSAISLGLILKALLTTAVADATGILAAGILGVLGFAVIPYRRSAAKKQLREKLTTLQTDLERTLRKDFERELGNSLSRLRESLAPYRRFVISEKEKVDGILTRLDQARAELKQMQTSLEEDR
ncbi:MAG: dynamin family protein [Anaerolineales bacterium]|nr:dynamin family protein [Anaerolineales bacterium]